VLFRSVFDANTNTSTVYEHIGTDIVKSVTSGINGTIFAYGQTSSGKTHTMLGSGDQGGVLEMAAKDIFRQISETNDRDFLLRVSFVEIYNEVIRDLLSDAADPTVAIREDPRKGVYCEATEIIITDYDSIIKALKRGTSKRTVESTAMNDTSSRSHTIFKLVVESKQSVGSDGSVLVASLNLVDLAGSESVRHTGATGQRAKEGGKINQSLLSLSRVIHALSQPGQHVSFRDSKLTRLLQSSLSGNAKMSVVCCITPAEKYLEETRSTLQFASRAKLVKTNATVNEVIDESVQLRRLKKELEMLKERQGNMVLNDEEYAKMEAEKDALTKQLISLQEEKDKQREQIDRLRELIIAGGDKGDDDKENESKFRRNKKRETWCPGAAPLAIAPLTAASTATMPNNFMNDANIEAGDISFNSSTSTIVLESAEDASLLKAQLQEALSTIELKNNEIDMLKENLSSAIAIDAPSNNDMNQSLEYEPIDLRTRLMEKDLRSQIEKMQCMLDEANNKVASLEQELDEANITKELSESDMDVCFSGNDSSKTNRISELELQLADSVADNSSLKESMATFEAKYNEVTQQTAFHHHHLYYNNF
jgi:centromeric protein E